MTTDETTPTPPAPEGETREVTVTVPAHRVEQFRRFHERFLTMAAHWDARVGSEDLSSRRRGRHCHRRHGHREAA